MPVSTLAPHAPEAPAARDPLEGRFVAYRVAAEAPEIRAASPRRDWMDQTVDRFAYRCLPLVIGNQLGWDLINPTAFRARWLGGPAAADVQLQPLVAGDRLWASGHFGSAVLTFSAGYLFRTPPGVSLLVTGPLNCPKDGIYPLSGVVESDWTNATFTMNYQFTRPGQWVEFAAGEPFCRLIPLSLDLPEELVPELAMLDDEPEVAAKFRLWSAERNAFNRQLDNPWSPEAKLGWQKDYFQGRQAGGERIDRHRTQLRQREFGGQRSTALAITKLTSRPRIERYDAEHYLWRETELFHSRRHKSAQVLVGLAQTLRRARPLAGQEEMFLSSFDRLLEADPAIFSELWQEPRAYFWTRMAFQLTDAQLNGATLSPLAQGYIRQLGTHDVAEGLRAHLELFREFELAAAILAGNDWYGKTPLVVDLPWAIPATDWAVLGEGTCQVTAFRAGMLHLRLKGAEHIVPLAGGGDQLVRSPIVEHAGCRLRLQPQALARLGLAPVDAVLAEGDEYPRRHSKLLRGALAAIEHYVPEMFEQISGTVRIVGLKSSAGDFTNVSFSELPGAMLLSVIDHPLVMADRIIHEFHHNRLFHIEDSGSLFDTDSPTEEKFYSPWRADPRPLKGVLHGLYVYIAVGRFWLQVHRHGGLSNADQTLVIDQLLRTGRQVATARDELARHARFTPPGEGLFAQLSADVDELNAQISAAGLPADAPAVEVGDDGTIAPQCSRSTGQPLTVAEAIDEHRGAFFAE